MQKSRLTEVLRTFSKKELREFKKWLASPFHNQRQDVIDLYDYLLKKQNLHKDKALDKKTVFEDIYPEEMYDDAKMRQVIHFTFKALEAYLAYISFIEKGYDQELNLARSYRRKKLKRQFEKTIHSINTSQKKPQFKDDYFLYQKYLSQLEQYKFYNKSAKRTGAFNLQEISNCYDEYLIASKLKLACTMLSHQVVYKTNYSFTFIDEILEHLKQNPKLLIIPSIGAYYYIFKTLTIPGDERNFVKLKEQLNDYINVMPLEEIQNIYAFILNYCSKKMNSGKEEFIEEAWNLIKKGIEEKILIEDGILNRFIYRNFIVIGIRLKYFKEVEEYIFKYGQYLDSRYKEHFIKFNLAKLHFEKGNYGKAMELVHQYEFKDPLINLNAKTMLLKMYYELSEFKALESLLESMRAFLQRRKMIGNQQKSIYKNMINYTKKLLKINPYNKEQVAKLRQEIENASPLTEKAWLLKQLDEL